MIRRAQVTRLPTLSEKLRAPATALHRDGAVSGEWPRMKMGTGRAMVVDPVAGAAHGHLEVQSVSGFSD